MYVHRPDLAASLDLLSRKLQDIQDIDELSAMVGIRGKNVSNTFIYGSDRLPCMVTWETFARCCCS